MIDSDKQLHGLRYLRVIRGQKERKRKRLEEELNVVVLEIYDLNKKIDYLISEEVGMSVDVIEDAQKRRDDEEPSDEEYGGYRKKDD